MQHRFPAARPVHAVSQATDTAVVTTLAALAIVAVLGRSRTADWAGVAVGGMAFAVATLGASAVARRLRSPLGRFLLRSATVLGALLFTYASVPVVQLTLHGRFLDPELVAFQQRLLGGQPVLWLQALVRPWVTEWMMFAYVAYLALYPLALGGVWLRHGDEPVERCLLALSLASAVCAAGFVLFPVAGPHFFLAGRFTVPLGGGVFSALGELIRTRAQYPGASLPSPHCAYATVLWLVAWRYRRAVAVALAPIVLTLYAATVYGRYHYAADSLAGIVTGAVALAAAGWIAMRIGREAAAHRASRPGSGGAPGADGATPSAGRQNA